MDPIAESELLTQHGVLLSLGGRPNNACDYHTVTTMRPFTPLFSQSSPSYEPVPKHTLRGRESALQSSCQ
jgi:hypothetical protein